MRILTIILMAMVFAPLPLKAQDKINIFTCEPEWKSLAMEIGKDNVKTFSATTAKQDPHYIRAKPSLIAKIRKADLLICSGADLEIGWLPILLQKASANLQPGQTGHLMAANLVDRLETPDFVDRSMGDIHKYGNPHIHLNPENILIIAQEVNRRLQIIDPENAQNYQKNYDDFVKRWQLAMKKWQLKANKLKGLKVVVYHKSFSYLIDWLKIEEVAALEAKPGIAPSAKHLEKLLKKLKSQPANLIIKTPYDPDDASEWLSKKTGIKDLVLPYSVGGNEESDDLFSLFDNSINLLLKNK